MVNVKMLVSLKSKMTCFETWIRPLLQDSNNVFRVKKSVGATVVVTKENDGIAVEL
jgi:hypothetical protein